MAKKKNNTLLIIGGLGAAFVGYKLISGKNASAAAGAKTTAGGAAPGSGGGAANSSTLSTITTAGTSLANDISSLFGQGGTGSSLPSAPAGGGASAPATPNSPSVTQSQTGGGNTDTSLVDDAWNQENSGIPAGPAYDPSMFDTSGSGGGSAVSDLAGGDGGGGSGIDDLMGADESISGTGKLSRAGRSKFMAGFAG
jgi:hypothetical protein